MQLFYRCPIVPGQLVNLLSLVFTAMMSLATQADTFSISQEAHLPQTYETHIKPFWDEQVQKSHFLGEQGVRIHTAWIIHPQSRGTIVISSGRTEGSIKYKEVFYDLYQNGFSVFTLDHRGQGQSGRMASNPDKGHVEDFSFFVSDLHAFVVQKVLPQSQQQPQLLCHSMGCAIGALYLLSYPDTFAKVVFSSPMFGINAPIPYWLAKGVLATQDLFNSVLSDEPWYFLGQGDKKPEPFEGNDVTHSEVRYQISVAEFEEANAALGGITGQWLKSSIWAMQYIEEHASSISTPSLLLQSGGDTVVDNKVQEKVCTAMPDCQLVVIPEARHELLLEQDQYRLQAMNALLAFFSEQ